MASRMLVAAVGIAVIALAIEVRAADDALLVALVTASVVVAVTELHGMLAPMRPFVPVGLACAVATPLLTWRGAEAGLVGGIVVALPLTLLFASISAPRSEPLHSIAATLLPVGYVVLAASTIVLVREGRHGTALTWLMLVGTWVNDSAAFFGGRTFGRHRLAPHISPNKTVEGLCFGLVFGTFVVWYGSLIAGGDGHDWLTGAEGLLLGIVIAVATVLGDLFESLIKRAANTKDASHLLGGHGGMLDRLDALLLVAPATYAITHILGIL